MRLPGGTAGAFIWRCLRRNRLTFLRFELPEDFLQECHAFLLEWERDHGRLQFPLPKRQAREFGRAAARHFYHFAVDYGFKRPLWEADVLLGNSACLLFSKADVFQPTSRDVPTWRLVVKGDRYGASWSGRIDVYLHIDPSSLEPGGFVRLAHLEVKHRVWVTRWERQTFEHGVVSGYRRVSPGTDGAEEREEASQYVAILPSSEGEAVGTLVWASAYTKTTLKGLGRQYHARLEGQPLWSLSVTGGARSGRFHTTAQLAVVEEGNPLVHVFREGGEETRSEIAD